LVALDVTISPELFEEGIANEVNRTVQSLRKDAGYEISDHISLHLDGPLEEKWRKVIFDSALAKNRTLTAAEADIEKVCQVDDREFVIRLRRP
jgi:isoleucyl-tRNA synthetase